MSTEAHRKHVSVSFSKLAALLGQTEFDAIHVWVEPDAKYVHMELTAVDPKTDGWVVVPFDAYTPHTGD